MRPSGYASGVDSTPERLELVRADAGAGLVDAAVRLTREAGPRTRAAVVRATKPAAGAPGG